MVPHLLTSYCLLPDWSGATGRSCAFSASLGALITSFHTHNCRYHAMVQQGVLCSPAAPASLPHHPSSPYSAGTGELLLLQHTHVFHPVGGFRVSSPRLAYITESGHHLIKTN